MKRIITALLIIFTMNGLSSAQTGIVAENLNKKTFQLNENVTSEKVSFYTRLGIQIVGEIYTPKDIDKTIKYPGIIVGHPFGSNKEQSSEFYAQELASRGFVTLAFDMERYGESGGQPRNVATPEGFVEDFMSAMDFMGTRSFVDKERIGGIGICASGSLVMATASIDPRYKAIATVSMNDLGRSRRQGINDIMTRDQLKVTLDNVVKQRWEDFEQGTVTYAPGAPEYLDEKSDIIARDFYDYYRTPRGQHPRATTNTSVTSTSSFMLFYPFELIDLISPRPLLFITGEKAYTRYINEDVYKLASEPKELIVIPGATHVDLYDKTESIPFDKLESFFRVSLK